MSEPKADTIEIAINVLIIVHKQNQFAAAASFLTRRGFPCTVKGNIRDGLQFITKNKATHVFLSWNLPGANVVKTYQLIVKTFPVDCVVFAEKGDGKTSAELTMSRLPEVMQAPVSGPGLYMRVQKLLKAKEEGIHAAEKKSAQAQQQQNQKIVLKCSNKEIPKEGAWESAGVDPEDGQSIYRFKSSTNANGANSNGTYTFKGPKPPQLDENGNWDAATGAYRFETEEKQSDSKSGMVNFQKTSPQYSEEDYQEPSDPSMNDISDLLTGLETEDLSATADGNNLNSELSSSLENPESSDHSANENKNDSASGNWKSQRADKNYGSVVNVAKKKVHKEEELPEYEITKPKESIIIEVQPRIVSKGSVSILAEKVSEALKNSAQPKTNSPEKIDQVSEAKAFTIHSPRFNGYLLLTSAEQLAFNNDTIQEIKKQISSLLEKVGEKLYNFEELDLNFEAVDFNTWAKEYAEFMVCTVHNESELACAFFSMTSTLPKVKEHSDKMATISAKDVVADTKSKFNLFLHLPKNNKFIRYLRPGDSITESHTIKFKKHHLEDLHIKQEEVQSFKEYYAANKLLPLSKKKAS